MERPFNIHDLSRDAVHVEKNNESKTVTCEKNILSYEHACHIYESGMEMCRHIYGITQQDDVYCYQFFNKIHMAIFADLPTEEQSLHISHRILMRTTISNQEARHIISDQLDQVFFDKVFVPAMRATSKESMEHILDELRQYLGKEKEEMQ